MFKKGLVHILPLVIIALVIIGTFGVLSRVQEQKQKDAVSKVLSSSDSGGGDHGGGTGDSSGGGGGSSGSSGGDSKSSGGSSTSGSSGSSSTFKTESKTEQPKTKVETKPNETKVEVKTDQGKFETKVENGKEETKLRIGGLRIEIKKEGNRVVTKVKNEQEQEVEVGEEVENELVREAENELEAKDIQLATSSAQLGFVQHGKKVRTNFPLTVNPQNGELMVATPAGSKVVTILPDQAIQNMIKAGILTSVVEEPALAALPSPAGTPSATVAGAGIELTEVNNQPAFVINGIKSSSFLGLLPVDIHLKAVVSASNGQLLGTREGFFSRVLDLFSI